MVPMQEMRFYLRIPPGDYLGYYRGGVRDVVVRADDGRTVRFPAAVLRPFVTAGGVEGRFILRFDEQNRFAGISRCTAS